MKVSPLAGSRELLILIRGCDRIPMCIQLPLPLHGRIYTGGRLFTIGPSSTAVKLSFVLIVSLATLPFRVRYSCVTVCVPVTCIPCGETVSSLAGASASTGSPSPPDMISPGPVGWVGMTMLLSSSREIKISGNRSFVWFKGSLSFCSLWGGPAKDETFAFSRFSTDELFKQLLLHHNETTK